jgi:hypothetical protein
VPNRQLGVAKSTVFLSGMRVLARRAPAPVRASQQAYGNGTNREPLGARQRWGYLPKALGDATTISFIVPIEALGGTLAKAMMEIWRQGSACVSPELCVRCGAKPSKACG